MPKVPKWMANAMESLFTGSYHPVTVTKVDDLADGLRQVRWEGDFSKMSKPFIAGNVIEFRVSDTEFRHYTPSFLDAGNGVCDVLFYLHDKGPGSLWAGQLKAGDRTKLLGPGGRLRFDEQADRHLCFGDETSLGLFKCMAAEAAKRNCRCQCSAELDAAHREWPALLGLNGVSVHTGTGGVIQSIEENVHELPGTAFYLTGNARSIQAIKKCLSLKGVPNSRIHTEPYWTEGKAGL